MRAAKTDTNQREIVSALRGMGATVIDTSRMGQGYPDLTVGFQQRTFLIEVKSDKGKLTPQQTRFMNRWNGRPVAVVRDVVEAYAVLGIEI